MSAEAPAPQRARGGVPGVRPEGVWARMWRPFWTLPMAICLAAVVLGVALPNLDEALAEDLPYVFEGGPEGARTILGTISSAMISVTGLVFSITIVALQLASSQFTPRVLGTFLSNRITQVTLGVFTASFVFSLSVLRSVRSETDAGGSFVPQVSITTSFLLVLASVGLFLAFIHHITTSMQVAEVISRVGDDTVQVIDALYPHEVPRDEPPATGPTWSPPPGQPRVTVSVDGRHGDVVALDYPSVVAFAKGHDAVVTIEVAVGDFVPQGSEIARVWGVEELSDGDRQSLAATVRLASTRTLRQDVGFGIRQLVDIAERALSPGINDPTTAVQAVDELHRLLRELVRREAPSPYIADDDGVVRVVHRPQRVEDLITQAVREVAFYGRDSLRIAPRLVRMLDDLDTVSRTRYRPVIADLREQVRPRRSPDPDADRASA